VNSVIRVMIHGPKKIRISPVAMIFGTNVMFCSWIWVAA